MTDHIAHTWNWSYVALSYLVAVMATYVALDYARLINVSPERHSINVVRQGMLLGYGIWAMHFIGMRAFLLDAPVRYDLVTTVLSGLIAVLFVSVALFVLYGGRPSWPRLLISGAVAGVGMQSMHYTGMFALRLVAEVSYALLPALGSAVIAVSAATISFTMFTRGLIAARSQRQVSPWALRLGAALIMGLAVTGMHYTGMAAIHYAPALSGETVWILSGTRPQGLGLLVITLSMLFLGGSLLRTVRRQQAEPQAQRQLEGQRQTEGQRQAGTT